MADTLREYLVSLGFKIDEAKMHSFQDALLHTARSAAGLSAEVVGVGFALTEMVERVAKHFEDLYYMSQRTGATVSGLDAIGFAAKQVGLSSEQARGAVEGFADAMRMNPGLKGLAGWLIGRQDIDPERDLPALVKRLSTMPDFVAIRMAERFGISSQVYLQLKNNMKELEEAEKRHRERMKEAGVDLDKDKERWVTFTRQLNNTTDAFTVMGSRIADDWRPTIQGVLKDIQGLAEGFNQANKSSEGMFGKITSLIAAFGGVAAVAAIIGRVLGFKGAGGAISRLGLVGLPLLAIHEMIQSGAEAEKRRGAGEGDVAPGLVPPRPRKRGNDIMGVGEHDHGLYDYFDAPPLPRPRPSGATTMHINQTNNINGAQSPTATAAEIKNAHRELGDALRNMYSKVQ